MAGETARRDVLAAVARVPAGDGQPTMEELAAAAGISVRTLYRLFGSREALLRELGRPARRTARDLALGAALELIGRHGLADLSMDEVAAGAGVSRATLYRLFPGKSALFRGVIQAYSPWEAVADVVDAMSAEPPEEVVPAIARALAAAMEGRTALLLSIVFELLRRDPDAAEGVGHEMARGLPDLVGYLDGQMEAGRLRRMDPVLAAQLLGGPIFAHLLTRPLADVLRGPEPATTTEVADEIAAAWLRAMAPDQPSR